MLRRNEDWTGMMRTSLDDLDIPVLFGLVCDFVAGRVKPGTIPPRFFRVDPTGRLSLSTAEAPD
jgi:hypothetical protein